MKASTDILQDGTEPFEVLTFIVPGSDRTVLFAPGRGGDPARHLPLLEAIADSGHTVITPRAPMMPTLYPTEDDLVIRARRLSEALSSFVVEGSQVVGIGHSIGATVLLGLAGADMWLRTGDKCALDLRVAFERLILLAPATGFFGAPNALDAVRTDTILWAGDADVVVPVADIALLQERLAANAESELRIAEGAGHFSFMNKLPPNVDDVHPDKEAFLDRLTAEVIANISSAR